MGLLPKRSIKYTAILLFFFSLSFLSLLKAQVQNLEKYKNTDLTFEERVADLVSRMTLKEKISQLSHLAPSIERLGVIEYGPTLHNPLSESPSMFVKDAAESKKLRQWENLQYWKDGDCLDGGYWNEALHGLARSGLSTVFPQVIGLGCTWNPKLIHNISDVIADEARVHNRLYGKKLTFWSPTINMLRDPRWGRTEEAYSEDPYLQSRMAVAFVRGLQGNDPKYFKAIATVKHFAANNSEVNRHTGSSDIPERQLHEYYFPAFKAAITEGGAFSVMGAYNKVNGVPSCANSWLLTDILRNEWGFKGFVVSDCGAISDIVHTHKFETDPEKAVAAAVKAGCDLECETCEKEQFLYDRYLLNAVTKGYISEKEIELAVARIFLARFRLGEFDPPEMTPYNNIHETKLDCAENRELALQAARESIVLLKNQGDALPLDLSKIKKIALIGPNANQAELGGYTGTPSYKISPHEGLSEKLGENKIQYEPGCLSSEAIPGGIEKAVLAAKNSDVAIVVLGTSLLMATEGKDKPDLDLPDIQLELLKKVYAANPKTILVLVNGTPLSINWAEDKIAAIVEAWYPGQAGGKAIAEVLFGDYNPSGKMTVTSYHTSDQLPPITDYDITKGRTYWYYEGDVLYPFGHGLSYTTFEYSSLTAKPEITLSKEKAFTLSFKLKNTGKVAGDEVVQLYIHDLKSEFLQPKMKLRAFQKIHLGAGKEEMIQLSLSLDDFSFWNPELKAWAVEGGEFEIKIGSSSKDIRLTHKLNVNP